MQDLPPLSPSNNNHGVLWEAERDVKGSLCYHGDAPETAALSV